MKGCRVVGTSNRVRQGSADMMTHEVREGFQGRSWGATKKNVPYFTTLSKILVVIRVPGKSADKFTGVFGSVPETISHANIY